jgi:hypothetical protein
MATSAGPRKIIELPGEELSTLIGLMSGSDSVELKVTLPEDAHRSAVAALGLDPLESQIRQVFFFDTPDLILNQAGIAVRARRSQGRSGDTVVKLRPVVPQELPEDTRHSASLKVEVDAMPGGYICSASMKGRATNEGVRALVGGKGAIRKLFSKEQRAYYTANAPEGLVLDDLRILGPIFVLKVVTVPADLGRKLTAEMWFLPDGSRILELSTKCLPNEAFQVAVETRAHLEGVGLDLSGETQTKTKTALALLAAELDAKGTTG